MIAKRRRRPKEPIDVHMTLAFNFGDTPDDRLTVLDNRKVPMAGSVFEYRDRIVRGFIFLLLRTSAASPKVIRELFPALRLLNRSRRES